jgi:uncharacterized damage-inducible protein DinB
MQDTRTTYQNYPVPEADNFLQDDVGRLAQALTAVDADVYLLRQHQATADSRIHTLQQDVAHPAAVDISYTDGRVSGMTETFADGQRTTQYQYDTESNKLTQVDVIFRERRETTTLNYDNDTLTGLTTKTESVSDR